MRKQPAYAGKINSEESEMQKKALIKKTTVKADSSKQTPGVKPAIASKVHMAIRSAVRSTLRG
jgi:hypothetical protein